jgi:NAD(P)-dependent dehydrogenase (short-subunit alcohol dehydrogenase family)
MAKTVLITGANRGIGLGLTWYFLEKGYDVVATTRNLTKSTELNSLAKDYTGRCVIETCDVKSDLSVKALADKLKAKGSLDILINNAGISKDSASGFKETSLKDVEEMFHVNAVSAMRVTQEVIGLLEKATAPIIANISSKMGSMSDNASGGYYGYRMSKAAMNMFAVCLAKDFPNITTVTLHPGWVKTDMGGQNAPTTVKESTKGLGSLIENLKKPDSGKFLDFQGETIPW